MRASSDSCNNASNQGPVIGRPVHNAVLRLVSGIDLRLHPCSVTPAEGPEKCGPRRPTRNGYSCNNAVPRRDESFGQRNGFPTRAAPIAIRDYAPGIVKLTKSSSMPIDRIILTCRCDTTLVGRGRSSERRKKPRLSPGGRRARQDRDNRHVRSVHHARNPSSTLSARAHRRGSLKSALTTHQK